MQKKQLKETQKQYTLEKRKLKKIYIQLKQKFDNLDTEIFEKNKFEKMKQKFVKEKEQFYRQNIEIQMKLDKQLTQLQEETEYMAIEKKTNHQGKKRLEIEVLIFFFFIAFLGKLSF
jgi:hypothetical protein